MTTRLPLLPKRPPPALAQAGSELESAEPRVTLPRPLVCIASADAAQDAALRFALAVAQELRARGCAAAALADAGVRAEATLAQAGVTPTLVLPHADQGAVAVLRRALEALPQDTLVLGVGRELSARFTALLSVAIAPGAGEADLWLPAPSAAVASAIGAWVADHLCSAAMHS